MESKHWKQCPSANEQLTLFDMPAIVALASLRRYVCPPNNVEFLYPRLFNPAKPIPELHDDSFDCIVYDFPELVTEPEAA